MKQSKLKETSWSLNTLPEKIHSKKLVGDEHLGVIHSIQNDILVAEAAMMRR